MCFDSQTSLLAWSLAFSIATFLYYRNRNFDRWNAAFIITFTTIQLLEAGLWTTIGPDGTVKPNERSLNEMLTKVVLIALTLQPLVQTWAGHRALRGVRAPAMVTHGLAWGSAIVAAVLAYSLMRVARASFSSTPGPRGHLVWSASDSPGSFLGGGLVTALYLLGLFVPLLAMGAYGGWARALPLLAVGGITAWYSATKASPEEFGSYWCYTAVAYALVAVFV